MTDKRRTEFQDVDDPLVTNQPAPLRPEECPPDDLSIDPEFIQRKRHHDGIEENPADPKPSK